MQPSWTPIAQNVGEGEAGPFIGLSIISATVVNDFYDLRAKIFMIPLSYVISLFISWFFPVGWFLVISHAALGE